MVDDLQSGDQLAAKVAGALAVAAERRQRLDQRARAHRLAIIGFDAPDRGDDRARNAVALLRQSEGAGVFAQAVLAVGDPLVVDEAGEIVPDRRLEFRLVLLQAEDFHVRLHAGGRLVEDRAPDSAMDGLVANRGETRGEIRPRGAGRRERGGEDSEEKAGARHWRGPNRHRGRSEALHSKGAALRVEGLASLAVTGAMFSQSPSSAIRDWGSSLFVSLSKSGGSPSPQPSPASGRGGAPGALYGALQGRQKRALIPSPACGRRWPEGPDEGSPLRRCLARQIGSVQI